MIDPKKSIQGHSVSTRLMPDMADPIAELCQSSGLNEAEVLRRLLRLGLRPVIKDKTLIFSQKASQPL